MPEQLTKHPEVTLKVLRSTGARCGEGAPQAILKSCRAERFCQLPAGEICVYGLDEAAQMTQITPAEWAGLLAAQPREAPPVAPIATAPALLIGGAGLLLGVALGAVLSRWRRH